MAMLKLATEGNPFFALSDVEGTRVGTTYSIDTITELRNRFERTGEYFFLVGQDAFAALKTWKDWERLLTLCHFVVMTRPGYPWVPLKQVLSPEVARHYTYKEEEDCFLPFWMTVSSDDP